MADEVKKEEWWSSTDEEHFGNGPHDTKDAAVLALIVDEVLDTGSSVYVGRKGLMFHPVIHGDDVCEHLADDASVDFGEIAEDWPGLSAAQEDELGKKLTEVLCAFLADHGEMPTFFQIEGVERVEVTDALIREARKL